MDSMPMLAVTKVLKPGPARIAKLAPGLVLPRTVRISALIVGGIGGVLFTVIAVALPPTRNLRSIMLAFSFGVGLGVFLTSYSPLKGESTLRWLGLEVMSRQGRVLKDGKPARMYVGICPIERMPAGRMRIVAGAVEVPEGSVDNRGLPKDNWNRRSLKELGQLPDRPETRARAAHGLPGPNATAPSVDSWAQAANGQPGSPTQR